MEATGSVIERKCLTLGIKQSVHWCFKNIWEVNEWSKSGEDASLPNGWGKFLPEVDKSTFNLN
jgi:hypothetical protein